MMRAIIKISFGDSVKKWSYDQFIAHFQPIYPGADLDQYAAELGIKPVAIVPDKTEGGHESAPSKNSGDDENKPGDPKNSKNKRKGAGKRKHEADEERLHRMAAGATERGEEENGGQDHAQVQASDDPDQKEEGSAV